MEVVEEQEQVEVEVEERCAPPHGHLLLLHLTTNPDFIPLPGAFTYSARRRFRNYREAGHSVAIPASLPGKLFTVFAPALDQTT